MTQPSTRTGILDVPAGPAARAARHALAAASLVAALCLGVTHGPAGTAGAAAAGTTTAGAATAAEPDTTSATLPDAPPSGAARPESSLSHSTMSDPMAPARPAAGGLRMPGQGIAGANPPGAALGPPAEDIRDIRGPKDLYPRWLVPALMASAVVLLALIAYAFWRTRRKTARVLLPFELALQRLEAIRPLMVPASVREFSIAVSDIVRGYIEDRFRVTAAHRTTEEFLRDLLGSKEPALVQYRGLLDEFLNQADLVKFAGVSLSTQNMEAMHQSARSFVTETGRSLDPTVARAASPAPGTQVVHDSLPSA